MSRSLISLLGFGLLSLTLVATANDPDHEKSSSKSKSESTGNADCTQTCDPMTGSGKYMDQAYENSYSPCLSEAVKEGITADQNHCTEKATAYCIQACEDGS